MMQHLAAARDTIDETRLRKRKCILRRISWVDISRRNDAKGKDLLAYLTSARCRCLTSRWWKRLIYDFRHFEFIDCRINSMGYHPTCRIKPNSIKDEERN